MAMIHIFSFRLSILFTVCLINVMACIASDISSDTHLGEIDKLMLLKEIKGNGITFVKEKIENIQKHTGDRSLPLVVTYVISSGNNSVLAKKVLIAQKVSGFVSKNPKNIDWNNKIVNFTPIDECTCVFEKQKTITVISTFFNPAILFTFLENLDV